VAETSTKLAELNGKLNLVRQANRAGLLNHSQQVDHMAKAQQRHCAALVEASAAEESWKAQSDYVDLLKGFRNKIFDEVLEAISADATAIVGTLPNSQHISVEFRSEKVTQEGTVQEKIVPVTYLHGEERSLEEAVSGGQLTSIGLAVDLAVSGVISQRLGCNLNWISLDESFEGHDTITKGSCLEMLQTYAANKLVIIVDHASETKEMFTQSIVVIHENKASRFQ
jgi:DNA repair exonuclease SbcCD ATPase subunit